MANAGARAYMGVRGEAPEADDVFVSDTLIFDASVIMFNNINDTLAPF